jgi:uncharacterized protein (DUF433 family)
MSFAIEAETIPLRIDPDGTVRVGATRVPLDTIVGVFKQGVKPEEIARQFPAVELADAYAVIGYYLRHTAAVEAYLDQREKEAAVVQRDNEARFPPEGVRERLTARRGEKRE